MTESDLTTGLVIRQATFDDIPAIEALDRYGTSPLRNIHHDLQKYFGSLDPSMHERNLIFLAEADAVAVGKAELVLAPATLPTQVGYIKRVVVHPDYRGHGIAHQLMKTLIAFSRAEGISFLDLHVFEQNLPAIRLYESLGFQEGHREIYYRLHLQNEP
ncbi:MAG TPA: GNAT family N-acetyltransferase [Ktedonobacterales bacterium]|jgi:ribosomal protein S18 acetylase RimI-like enzyme